MWASFSVLSSVCLSTAPSSRIFVPTLSGGTLANPARQYPKAFGHIQFFKDYPYALPTMVVGVLNLATAAMSSVFIKETLMKKKKKNDGTGAAAAPMSTWQLLRAPGVPMVLLFTGYVMLLAYMFTAIIPVFWFEPVKYGGFGFTPLQISLFLGSGGLAQAIWLLLPFPPLQRRIGTSGVIKVCAMAWPFFFAANPICNLFLRRGATAAFWAVAPAANVLGSGVAMAFTATQLALNDVAPSPDTLGTLNALALTLGTGLRAVSPAASTALYALGVEKQIAGGQLGWIILIIISLGLRPLMLWFPKSADGKLKKPGDQESQDDE
jgi:hypothetical protein